jgi:hypothetical protein
MNRHCCVLSLAVVAACAALARAESDPESVSRWNGYGFYAGGSAMGETRAGLTGGGGGAEAYLWKRLAVGADISGFTDRYYRMAGAVGHAGAQAVWHFASREKARGADPFLAFGVGRHFPEQSRAVYHGGAGLHYWFRDHVGARFEFRVAERQHGDNVYGVFRLGVVFR